MIVYRALTSADLDLVVYQREAMFRASGRAEGLLTKMAGPFREWLRPRLEDGRYFGWIAHDDVRPIGGLGMMVIDWPPHPSHPEMGERAYILNVFVEPEQRGRGIATALMDRAVEEASKRGLSYAILHATPRGRPLYERLGWVQTSEMGLAIPCEA